MPDRDEATSKSKEVKHPPEQAGSDTKSPKEGRVFSDELESIPTVVPREGDGYRTKAATGVIGETGRQLSNDDLQRINTRKGLIELLQQKRVDLEEVRKTLLYEEELKCLQVELVRFQRWVQSSGRRIAIIVEGRDAAGKGGTIRRFTEHLNPRAMRVVALPKPTEQERGQWYFQRYIQQLPNKGEIVFFDRSWYNRAVVEPVMGFCTRKEHQRFLQQVTEFEHMLYEDGVTLIKFWFSISKEQQQQRFEARRTGARPQHRHTLLPENGRIGPVTKGRSWIMATTTVREHFAQDHDRLDALFESFQSLKRSDFSAAKEAFKAFKTGLQRHIVWEDDVLFPLWEEKCGEGRTRVVSRH
jgi:polyphosphate kinase 2